MVRATNVDIWTCPSSSCNHRTISRQSAESEAQWIARRDRVQIEHGLVHEAETERKEAKRR